MKRSVPVIVNDTAAYGIGYLQGLDPESLTRADPQQAVKLCALMILRAHQIREALPQVTDTAIDDCIEAEQEAR